MRCVLNTTFEFVRFDCISKIHVALFFLTPVGFLAAEATCFKHNLTRRSCGWGLCGGMTLVDQDLVLLLSKS